MRYEHTTKQICNELSLNQTTVDYWRTTNKVSCRKIDNKFYFNLEEVKQFIENKKKSKKLKGFYCEFCKSNTKYNSWSTFTKNHLTHHNISSKEYYDKFLLSNKDEKYCENCGNEKSFISPNNGYKKYCSSVKCRGNNSDIQEKIEKTKLNKYGDKHFTNTEKHKQTCLERYGEENYTNREKALDTIKDKFGVSNLMYNEDIKNKCLQTKSKNKSSFYETNNNITVKKLDDQFLTFVCGECEQEVSENTKFIYSRGKYNINICTNCYPKCENRIISFCEKDIFNYIKEKIGNNIRVIENDRSAIGKELDIYLPDLNLAFEYNGFYWHSDKKKSRKYHSDKTDICESKNIRLIHIFEDEWKYKREIVKSKIDNLLGLTNNKIFGRKCEIIYNVDVKSQKEFYNSNHIQGWTANKKTIGLKYNNDYVSMMSFSKNRNIKLYDFELVRFATKKDSLVIGGASKLFKCFINENKNKSIVSYADRCWSYGNLYDILGFKCIKITPPSYFYVDPKYKTRIHRFRLRKSQLLKKGFDIQNRTEFNIIDNDTDFLRIYNSGFMTYLYK